MVVPFFLHPNTICVATPPPPTTIAAAAAAAAGAQKATQKRCHRLGIHPYEDHRPDTAMLNPMVHHGEDITIITIKRNKKMKMELTAEWKQIAEEVRRDTCTMEQDKRDKETFPATPDVLEIQKTK